MRVSINELRTIIHTMVTEAKKKAKKAAAAKRDNKPAEYTYAESFDFSAPLEAYNLYKSQGASNWGPMTGPGPKIDHNALKKEGKGADGHAKGVMSETNGAWGTLEEMVSSPAEGSLWEAAQRWYDHVGYGLGHQTSEGIEAKKEKAEKRKKASAKDK